MNEQKLKIAFFGTPDIAVWVLQALHDAAIIPTLVVTNPDQRQGRGMERASSPVKKWAQEHSLPVFQPESLAHKEELRALTEETWDLFVVVAYGAIMPAWLLKLPKYGTLNVHPSLLPKLRGASPIRTSILQGLRDTGVTIMLMDEKMDHGPILKQKALELAFPEPGRVLDKKLAHEGGVLLAEVIPQWVVGNIQPQEQDHTKATYCKKITKEMGELSLDPRNLPTGEDAYAMYLKICAYDNWPGTYFFHNGKRIKITGAHLADKNSQLQIDTVIPEGKKEIPFAVFLQNI